MHSWRSAVSYILDLMGGRRHTRTARQLLDQIPQQDTGQKQDGKTAGTGDKPAKWLKQQLLDRYKQRQQGTLIAVAGRLLQMSEPSPAIQKGVLEALQEGTAIFNPNSVGHHAFKPGTGWISRFRAHEIGERLLQQGIPQVQKQLIRGAIRQHHSGFTLWKHLRKRVINEKQLRGLEVAQTVIAQEGQESLRRRIQLDQNLQKQGLWQVAQSGEFPPSPSDQTKRLLVADQFAQLQNREAFNHQRLLQRTRALLKALNPTTEQAVLTGIWEGLRISDPQFHTGFTDEAFTGGWLSRTVGGLLGRRLFTHPHASEQLRERMILRAWEARRAGYPRDQFAPWTNLRQKSLEKARWRKHPGIRKILQQIKRPRVQKRLAQDRRARATQISWAAPLSDSQYRQALKQLPQLSADQQAAVVGEILMDPNQKPTLLLLRAQKILEEKELSGAALLVLYDSLRTYTHVWNPTSHKRRETGKLNQTLAGKLVEPLLEHPGLNDRLARQLIRDGWEEWQVERAKASPWPDVRQKTRQANFLEKHPAGLSDVLAQKHKEADKTLLAQLEEELLEQTLQTVLLDQPRGWAVEAWIQDKFNLQKRTPLSILQKFLSHPNAQLRQQALLRAGREPDKQQTREGQGAGKKPQKAEDGLSRQTARQAWSRQRG